MCVYVYYRITDLLLPLQYWIYVSIIILRSVYHHKGVLLSPDEFSTDIILFHIFSGGRYSCLLSSYHLSSLLSSLFRLVLFRLLNRLLLFRLLNRLNLNWFTLCRLLLYRLSFIWISKLMIRWYPPTPMMCSCCYECSEDT